VEVARSGELAWVQETYEFSLQDPEGRLQEDRGKAVLIWKKQTDGGWKAIADIFNSDLPLSAPAEQGQ
jgi:ketosteroid isomerase-like protein